MRQINVKSRFKLSRDDAAANKAALAANPDAKLVAVRPSINWSFNGLQDEHCSYSGELPGITGQIVAACINDQLERFGKALLAKSADAEYVPAMADVTLPAWYADYTAEITRTREVTAATLKAFAAAYVTLSVKLCGVPVAKAAGGGKVIEAKLLPIMGNRAAVEMFAARLDSLLVAVAESDTPDILDSHMPVIEDLLKRTKEVTDMVTEDML